MTKLYLKKKNTKRNYHRGNIPRPTKYRPNYELANMKWEFHQYDDDDFPSVPHGHSLDRGDLKLHENGDIYQGKEVWGKLNKKDHKRLINDPRFKRLAAAAKRHHGLDANGIKIRAGRKRILGRRFSNKTLIFIGGIEKY